MNETKGSSSISTRLEQIAKLAQKFADPPLTTLAHHMDVEWLREAYRRTRKDGARGIDGQSAEEYAGDLEGNLQRLLESAKSGTYRAPPVRRVYIPKGKGEQRPLGIPTFEDKVLQRAVTMILEAVYEQEFLDCSYGFRPNRSARQALDALWGSAMKMGGGWTVEVDIRKFFDTIDHRRLQEVLRQRVRDGVIVRLIGKWLNAGVMEDGALQRSDSGTPQGGVITPPTQLTTCCVDPVIACLRSGSTQGRLARGRFCWRETIDDRRARLIDLHLRDERTDDLSLLSPRQRIKFALYTCRKILQVRRHGAQLDRVADLTIGVGDITTCSLDTCAQRIAAGPQIRQIDGTCLVRIDQSLEGALVADGDSRCVVALLAQVGRDAIAALSTRPLRENAFRTLKQTPHRLPDMAIELIDTHLRVVADSSAREAVRVAANATVVRVVLRALHRCFGYGFAVEGVPAARADRETLQQVPFSTRVALREALVALQLSLRRLEHFARDDRGHVNVDPLLGRSIAMSRLRVTRDEALAANRTKESSSLGRFRFAERCFAHLRWIAKNGPHGGAIPPWSSAASRDAVDVERAHDLADGFLLADERVEHASNDLRLMQQDAIAGRSAIGFLHVQKSVGSSAQRIDRALPSAMKLAASRAFQNLGALVFGDHALDLHEQLVFCGLPLGPLKEDRRHALPAELIEQKDLVGVLAREPIGTVHIQDFDRTFGDSISKSLERRTHECCAAETLVHVKVVRKNDMAIRDRAFSERLDLATHRGLLRLLLRRYTRVDGDRFHRLPPRARSRFVARDSIAPVSGDGSIGNTARSTTGMAISYAVRRYSSDSRVGAKATRSIRSRLAIDQETLHTRTGLSRKRQAVWHSALPAPAIRHARAKNLALHTAAPPEVCHCVGGVISPLLANIYLHTVLDVWFEQEVRVRLRGRAHLIRYADDAVMLFEYEDDARRVMAVLPKRFEHYGLTLHPDKTRLVPFQRPDCVRRNDDDGDGSGNAPRSFDFLGFTIHWGKSLAGKWVVKTRTAKDRFRRALAGISQWCKRHRHAPLEMQQKELNAKLRGHYGYYDRIANRGRLWALLGQVVRVWWRWLCRRSQRARLKWEAMNRLLKRYPLVTPALARPA